MKKLKISLLYDNVHFLFILIIILILVSKWWYFSILLIFYLIFLYKKTPLFLIGVILSIVVIASSIRYYVPFNESSFYGVVTECDNKKATIITEGNKVVIYHKSELSLGDSGNFKVIEVNFDSDIFLYSEYLLNNDIKNCYKLEEFKYEKTSFVLSMINNFFIKLVDKNPTKYNSYIKALIFADKSELDIYDKTQNIGISHMLAVSGMHISILIFFIEWVLKKLFYLENPINIFIIIFLIFYLIITNFEITIIRAAMMVILRKIFKEKKMLFTSLDILSIAGIMMLIVNPRWLFLLSFDLSFIVSFIIIVFLNNLNIKNKILQTYIISFIAFIVTLPFIINTNYEVNLLSIIVGPLYVLYFELILYPITLFMFLVPSLSVFFQYFYSFFENTITFFDNIKTFNLIFGELNLFAFILYEVILYFLLVSIEIKRGRILLITTYIMFLLIIYNKNLFNPFYEIKMYDVGQGDSFVIRLPYGRGNILFDCYNNVSKYLKRDGIRDIDIIFLSHGHSDHIGAYEEIANSFNVEYTYSSFYDESILLKDMKEKYDITLLKSDDYINYNEITFTILGPIRKYKKENDASLVVKFNILNTSFLFTGDIEYEAEEDLINKYGYKLKSYILKASHHGSNSSSSIKFIKHVDPDNILISVGKNNFYGFPNNNYLLKYCNVYRTDTDGVVCIYIRKNYFNIEK